MTSHTKNTNTSVNLSMSSKTGPNDKQIKYLSKLFEAETKAYSPRKLFNILAKYGMTVADHGTYSELTLSNESTLFYAHEKKPRWNTRTMSSTLKKDIGKILVDAGYEPKYIKKTPVRSVPAPN